MRKKPFRIASNWKMNPVSLSDAKELARVHKKLSSKYGQLDYELYVPDIYLSEISRSLKASVISLGAQSFCPGAVGSFTGEVSLDMLLSVGSKRVLIGHSYRRSHGISNEDVSERIANAIKKKTSMLVCFGEEIRDEKGDYIRELENQLSAICTPFGTSPRSLSLLSIAYEPVWAIGSNAQRAASEHEVFSTMILIRNVLSKYFGEKKAHAIPLLYGGSVNGENTYALSSIDQVDGFLVGRASLAKDSLEGILKAVSE